MQFYQKTETDFTASPRLGILITSSENILLGTYLSLKTMKYYYSKLNRSFNP